LVSWLFTCFYIVRGKEAAVLETLGKPQLKAKSAGFHTKLPWPITNVVKKVNLQLIELSETVTIKTSDNSFMEVPISVQCKVASGAEAAVLAHYELDDPNAQIKTYVLNSVRSSAQKLTLDELYSNRDDIETSAKEDLQERFATYGYEIVNVLVDEPSPSEVVREAFDNVLASKRNLEAAANEAQAEKKRLVGRAEAESESKELQGQGMSKMRDEIAKGMKVAIETMVDAGIEKNKALEMLMETNRQDTITTASANGNLILMDVGKPNDMASHIASVNAALKNKEQA
jgi:regulator of protease activity HflC (stomatin/prohibitin superfamily)